VWQEEPEGFLARFRRRRVGFIPPGPHRLSSELLEKSLGKSIPDFAARLADRIAHTGKTSRLRVLSLCSGDAAKELRLLQAVKQPERISITLVDRDGALLTAAKEKLEGLCDVDLMETDPNSIDLQGARYDIILCFGALGRLVELERVVEQIWKGLMQEGEFWSIGQYIGWNGAQLWPDAYPIANAFFRRMPERYRINHSWPDKRVDTDIPTFDFSIGTFECIRSQEIETALGRMLLPHTVTKQSCFVWRFFDPAYRLNYDVRREVDLRLIHAAVALDAEHQRQGGKPSNLDGVYRRRM
jgi:hypothetical protein